MTKIECRWNTEISDSGVVNPRDFYMDVTKTLKSSYDLSSKWTIVKEDDFWYQTYIFKDFEKALAAKPYFEQLKVDYATSNFHAVLTITLDIEEPNFPLLKYVGFKLVVFINDKTTDGSNTIEKIFSKYIGRTDRRQAILQCQKDLIDAGFKDHARL